MLYCINMIKNETNTKKLTYSIRIGNAPHIFIGIAGIDEDEMEKYKASIEKKAYSAMLRGERIVRQSGAEEWINHEEIHPYQWHKDGNRVLNQPIHFYKDPDGKITKVAMKKVWRKVL